MDSLDVWGRQLQSPAGASTNTTDSRTSVEEVSSEEKKKEKEKEEKEKDKDKEIQKLKRKQKEIRYEADFERHVSNQLLSLIPI